MYPECNFMWYFFNDFGHETNAPVVAEFPLGVPCWGSGQSQILPCSTFWIFRLAMPSQCCWTLDPMT